MRLTEKGQVTIPRDIRAIAGFQPGTELTFTFDAGKVTVTKAIASGTSDKRHLLRAAAARARSHMKPEFAAMNAKQIMAFVRPA